MNPNRPTDTEKLAKGAPFTVRLADGGAEEVTVRMLKISDYKNLPDPHANYEAWVCAIVGRNLGWMDNVDPASFLAMGKECERINASFFDWLAAKMRVLPAEMFEALMGLGREAVEKQQDKAVNGPR